ncbi:hypothetical protein C5167_007742 [Papaver somniferum]|nr:hypothetical protein C5167_007737 [Papaver somniferum]RZC85128.1 hypothetical protein C5167_007742 [Papaver somniferum]
MQNLIWLRKSIKGSLIWSRSRISTKPSLIWLRKSIKGSLIWLRKSLKRSLICLRESKELDQQEAAAASLRNDPIVLTPESIKLFAEGISIMIPSRQAQLQDDFLALQSISDLLVFMTCGKVKHEK